MLVQNGQAIVEVGTLHAERLVMILKFVLASRQFEPIYLDLAFPGVGGNRRKFGYHFALVHNRKRDSVGADYLRDADGDSTVIDSKMLTDLGDNDLDGGSGVDGEGAKNPLVANRLNHENPVLAQEYCR